MPDIDGNSQFEIPEIKFSPKTNPKYNHISFISVPHKPAHRPCAASGMLSAVLRDVGLKTSIHDLVIDLSHAGYTSNLTENFALDMQDDFENVKAHVKNYIQEVINESPDLIALSLLSYHSHRWCLFILEYIKAHSNIPTIIGGPGVSVPMQDGAVWRSVNINIEDTFGKYCLENKLTDYYHTGEGEFSLRDLCLGKDNIDGINTNTPARLPNLEDPVFPDFTDWKKYDMNVAVITASRGCVRRCTFCDVIKLWPTYRYRSGEHVFKEMMHQYHEANMRHFVFTDSLVNGNKEYKKILKLLADFNRNTVDKISWEGQNIIRKKNFMSLEDFDNLRDSGVTRIYIGIESGSESVRDHMLKKFSNEDMYYEVEQMMIRGIEFGCLIIVGYPTETREDFEETKEFVKWCSQWKEKIIMSFSMMQIIPGTPIWDTHHMLLNDELIDGESDWSNDIVGGYDERLNRWLEIYLEAWNMGYTYNNFIRTRVKSILNRENIILNDNINDLLKSVDLG